jgi:hypothetical protein
MYASSVSVMVATKPSASPAWAASKYFLMVSDLASRLKNARNAWVSKSAGRSRKFYDKVIPPRITVPEKTIKTFHL